MILPVDNSVGNPVDNWGLTATATAYGNPPSRSKRCSDLRKHDRVTLTDWKPPSRSQNRRSEGILRVSGNPPPTGTRLSNQSAPQGPERHEEPTDRRSPNATDHPTSSTPPERLAPPLPTVPVAAMSTDRTVEACERLFDLTALEAVPYRREPAIVTRRPSWQAAYATAAMFAYGCQFDHDDTEEVA